VGPVTCWGVATGTARIYAAFGVFFGLEVLDLDRFLSFLRCHIILFSFLVGLYCVRSTEEQLMPACNVLFWNQVIQTNHFFLSALWPLIS